MLTNPDFKSGAKVVFLLGFVVLMIWKGFHTTPKIAPNLSFTTITGKQIKLADLHGKPVLVNFWATSCPSCLKEIPALTSLYNRWHPQGLELIAVAMAYDPPSHVVNLSKTQNLPYDIVLDLNGDYAKAFGEVRAIPATFVIAPDGKIIDRELGLFDLAKMEKRLENLIKG